MRLPVLESETVMLEEVCRDMPMTNERTLPHESPSLKDEVDLRSSMPLSSTVLSNGSSKVPIYKAMNGTYSDAYSLHRAAHSGSGRFGMEVGGRLCGPRKDL